MSLVLKLKELEKMKVSKIILSGFRNVKHVELNLEDITSLVSLNSYGKSNVLHGIDFGIQFISAPIQIKDSMMRMPSCIPITKSNQNQNYFIDITFDVCIDGVNYSVNYSYGFSWVKKFEEPKITNELLRIKTDYRSQKYEKIISRNLNRAFYKRSEKGRCSSVMKITDNELLVNKLLAYDNYYYFDIVKSVNEINMHIERHLDASSSYKINPILIKGQKPLSIKQEENVPRLIYSLKEEHYDKYKILVNSYMQLFDDFSDIIVKEIDITNQLTIDDSKVNLDDAPFVIDNKIYRLFVIDKRLNQPLNFEYLSDGAKRVFLLLAYAIIADISGLSILVIEEPENSVHPSLLQAYLELLNDISVNCNIIITSHSPYVIQYLEPRSIYIGIPNDNGIANFSRISAKSVKKLYDDSNRFSDSIGNYIFDLLSGSDDSIEILNSYLEIQEDVNE